MAETVKKTATPAKPRKAATKKKTASKAEAVSQARPEVSQDQVAQLAHKYWQERGYQHGHHEDDWYRAERELRNHVS